MRTRRPILPLVAGLAVSVLLHGTILVPRLVAVMSATRPDIRLQARFDPEDFQDPQEQSPPPEEALRLGIDAPTPSTLTWIGYKEYRQHLAALAEIEQAAFRTNPTGTAQPSPPDDAETGPPATQTPATADPLAELAAWLDALGLGPAPEEPAATDSAHIATAGRRALPDLLAALGRWLGRPPESPSAEQVPQPTDSPTQPSADEATPDRGDLSDKESDPTSVIDVPRENWQTGRPIAAQGLQIKPRKPSFTALVLLSAAPGNPLCEIRFRRDGKPALARILERSGDARVDEAILNSLYRWRATGKQLETLSDGETIAVRIRIVLVRSRSS